GGTLDLVNSGSISQSSDVVDDANFNIAGLTNGGTSIVGLSGNSSGRVNLGANALSVADTNAPTYLTNVDLSRTLALTILTSTETPTRPTPFPYTTLFRSGGTLDLVNSGSISQSSDVVDDANFNIAGLTNGGTSIVGLSGNSSGRVNLGANA